MKLESIEEAAFASIGTHRAPCPTCARGRRDDAVSVTVDGPGRYVWFCHRCESAGTSGSCRAGEVLPRVTEHYQDGLAPWASELWESSSPIAGAGLAYLRARHCVIPPGDLRYSASLRHSPSQTSWPGLVALVTEATTNQPISLHRTWICADGTKAPVSPARMLAAKHRAKNGVIRLWPDDTVTHGLAVAEGIETALAVAHGYTPVWSLIDAGNLSAFPVLPGIESLLIAADHDDAGMRAADACALRWDNAGREVSIIVPNRQGRDFNDVATEEAA